jgi:outer membrane protein
LLKRHNVKNVAWAVLFLLTPIPLLAQHRVDFFVDAEGVRRNAQNSDFTPGIRFEPSFDTGGGVGGGINYFFTDRVSLEAKVSGLASKMRVRVIGSDFVAVADLGYAQFYPISATLQWHLLERGAIRPYIGAGVSHVILRNISKGVGNSGATGISFKDPTGFVVDGGLEFNLGSRFSLFGDARYIPIETDSRATFTGTSAALKMHVRPLIVSAGLAYHF